MNEQDPVGYVPHLEFVRVEREPTAEGGVVAVMRYDDGRQERWDRSSLQERARNFGSSWPLLVPAPGCSIAPTHEAISALNRAGPVEWKPYTRTETEAESE